MKTLALHTHTLVTHSSRKDKRLRRRERERSFEQGVKRFSCLIQPPRKLSKTKDPSSRLLLHACVVNVVRTENEAISQILLFFRTFCSYKNGCRYVASTFEMTPLSWI